MDKVSRLLGAPIDKPVKIDVTAIIVNLAAMQKLRELPNLFIEAEIDHDICADHARALHENELFDAIRDGLDIEVMFPGCSNPVPCHKKITLDDIIDSSELYRVHPKYSADPYLKFREAIKRGDNVLVFSGDRWRLPNFELEFNAHTSQYKIIPKTFDYNMALWLAKQGFFVQQISWHDEMRAHHANGLFSIEGYHEPACYVINMGWRLCKNQEPVKLHKQELFKSQQEVLKKIITDGATCQDQGYEKKREPEGFKSQQEIWAWLSSGNKAIHRTSGACHSFSKDGRLYMLQMQSFSDYSNWIKA